MSDNPKLILCPTCGTGIADFKQLAEHLAFDHEMSTAHGRRRTAKCFCGMRFDSIGTHFRDHLEAVWHELGRFPLNPPNRHEKIQEACAEAIRQNQLVAAIRGDHL